MAGSRQRGSCQLLWFLHEPHLPCGETQLSASPRRHFLHLLTHLPTHSFICPFMHLTDARSDQESGQHRGQVHPGDRLTQRHTPPNRAQYSFPVPSLQCCHQAHWGSSRWTKGRALGRVSGLQRGRPANYLCPAQSPEICTGSPTLTPWGGGWGRSEDCVGDPSPLCQLKRQLIRNLPLRLSQGTHWEWC